MQVLDSDASTASGGSPLERPTSLFHMRHQVTQAQKQVDVLRLEKQRMEVRLTTAEAKYQIPEYWLVSCLTPSCDTVQNSDALLLFLAAHLAQQSHVFEGAALAYWHAPIFTLTYPNLIDVDR